ncbi:DUF1707 SHOCT-like domain-containing protein [Streptomyces gobiensis]|uniref:DUF1707 SHOCT-like domain-containing protein n=1 Tax=Streptomyces gobiensis TaxID=2875706 RepID=UPI001E514F52|nr:DUF1707 domain-containing protein [Streptomyces gobiensis]UGY93197.1 DUF1707 domain-containing protein [Streptomyces gobiensis]
MTDSSRAPAPRPRRNPELRASHADREAVAERLREAAGDGRIDLEELEERLERAFAAKTYGELEPLTADLPERADVIDPRTEEPLVLKSGAGDIAQNGYWVVPRRISAICRMGNIKIDFSQAECHQREVTLEINSGMGDVTIVVPHGWAVRPHGLRLTIGEVRNKATDPPHPGAPTLEITGRAGMGDVKIRYPNRWETRKRG